MLVQATVDPFVQPGYKTYRCLKELVLKALQKDDYSDELKEGLEVYNTDINPSNVQSQLDILSSNLAETAITDTMDVKKHLQS